MAFSFFEPSALPLPTFRAVSRIPMSA